MEEFNLKSNKLQKLLLLKKKKKKGVEYIPELQSYLGKIDRIVNTLKDGEISVVLLGSFSDGKTSAIAGLLGR